MTQGSPSKAAVFLERRVRTSKQNKRMHFLKSHKRIHKLVTLKDAGL